MKSIEHNEKIYLDIMSALILDTFPGSCTAPTIDEFSEEYGFDEDEVTEMLNNMEIFECTSCGWWQHPGDIFLGHKEDCEHDEMICGDCCNE